MQEQMIREPEIQPSVYWQGVWKRKKLIALLVVAAVFATAISSLFLTNIYQASAVITTASDQDASSSSAAMQMLGTSGLSGIADVAGVSLSSGLKLHTLESYLRSNVVREKVIVRNELLPVLLYKQWNAEKKTWKRPGLTARAMRAVFAAIAPQSTPKKRSGDEGAPTIEDGLRSLDHLVTIKSNVRTNTLTIAADHPDPEAAVRIVNDMLEALQDHLGAEKKRIANENKRYLEAQLAKAVDPVTRQKLYSLLSRQIEATLMAEVKGNIFKVIDPPRVPDQKIKPRRAYMVVLSFLFSLFAGVFSAIFLEYREREKRRSGLSCSCPGVEGS